MDRRHCTHTHTHITLTITRTGICFNLLWYAHHGKIKISADFVLGAFFRFSFYFCPFRMKFINKTVLLHADYSGMVEPYFQFWWWWQKTKNEIKDKRNNKNDAAREKLACGISDEIFIFVLFDIVLLKHDSQYNVLVWENGGRNKAGIVGSK